MDANQTTLKHHFSPTRLAKTPKYAKLFMKKQAPSYIAGEGIRWHSL